MKLIHLAATIFIAVCASNTPAKGLNDSEKLLQGQVSYVSDGDTLWLKSADGARHKVRFEGIDAPEICQPYGAESRAALQAKVKSQTVQVRANRRDDYGRLLGRVSVDGVDLGAWMVQNGHAWSYRYRWNEGPYGAQEREAQAARRGLFAASTPERPADFRRRNGPCSLAR
jgi:micrococcal nuclease